MRNAGGSRNGAWHLGFVRVYDPNGCGFICSYPLLNQHNYGNLNVLIGKSTVTGSFQSLYNYLTHQQVVFWVFEKATVSKPIHLARHLVATQEITIPITSCAIRSSALVPRGNSTYGERGDVVTWWTWELWMTTLLREQWIGRLGWFSWATMNGLVFSPIYNIILYIYIYIWFKYDIYIYILYIYIHGWYMGSVCIYIWVIYKDLNQRPHQRWWWM